MNALLTTLMNSPLFYPIVILLSVILLTVIVVVVAQKNGIKIISSIKSIIEFIQNTLVNLEFKNEKVNVVISLIAQAITYALAISSTSSNEEKVSDALSFIKNLAGQFKVTITDGEYIIIEQTLKMVFIFISSLNITTNVKYNKKLVKYVAKLNK